MTDAILLGVLAVLGLIPAVIASRKGRSFWRWWILGFIAWLPMTFLARAISPAGEPYHFAAPRALLTSR